MKTGLAIELLGKAISRCLSLDPEMAEKISVFKGRVIAIELQGWKKTIYLLPQAPSQGINRESAPAEVVITVAEHIDGEADTTLRGTPLTLFKMGLVSDVAPMMLKGEIEIDGDVKLGKEFKKMLGDMDIDWEEHLANLIGDVPAHHATQLLRKFSNWSRQSRDSLTSSLSEYLQEESCDVVSGAELEMFYNSVDQLRNDAGRLHARFEDLTGKSTAQ